MLWALGWLLVGSDAQEGTKFVLLNWSTSPTILFITTQVYATHISTMPGRRYHILLHVWRPSGDHCLTAAILMRWSGRTLRLTVAASGEVVTGTADIVMAFNLANFLTSAVVDAPVWIDAAQVAASGAFCPNRPHLWIMQEHARKLNYVQSKNNLGRWLSAWQIN